MLSLVKLKNPNLLQSLAKKTNANTMSATMMLSRINKSTLRWFCIVRYCWELVLVLLIVWGLV